MAPQEVQVEGTRFPLVTTVDEFMSKVQADARVALRIPILEYAQVLSTVHAKYDDKSAWKVVGATPVYCGGCLWAFPDSYIASLTILKGDQIIGVSGATPGFRKFGEGGRCPHCGGREGLLVYEQFSPAEITERDVRAIRKYLRDHARDWWKQQPSGSTALCDGWCYGDVQPGAGFLYESRLLCDKCTDEVLTDAVTKLRRNPHAHGKALLRKVRPYKE